MNATAPPYKRHAVSTERHGVYAGAYVACALEGLGLIRVCGYMVLPHLISGRLQRVLTDHAAPRCRCRFCALETATSPPTVRAFVDGVSEVVREAETGLARRRAAKPTNLCGRARRRWRCEPSALKQAHLVSLFRATMNG